MPKTKQISSQKEPRENRQQKLVRIEANKRAHEVARKYVIPGLIVIAALFAFILFSLYGFGSPQPKLNVANDTDLPEILKQFAGPESDTSPLEDPNQEL
ncbi:hypothetical protein MP228_013115 [Amoeboaphelidium protococcarum]|nr:hypothetical protein MP228_013115 [Amoeboaphelidium protococcarum]